MIVRSWRARTSREMLHQYAEHARLHVFPQIARIAGHRGALLLTREGGGDVEILVLTFWSSMKVVESFAGSPPDAAVVEPEAQAVLIDYDHTVQHYETTEAYGELFTA